MDPSILSFSNEKDPFRFQFVESHWVWFYSAHSCYDTSSSAFTKHKTLSSVFFFTQNTCIPHIAVFNFLLEMLYHLQKWSVIKELFDTNVNCSPYIEYTFINMKRQQWVEQLRKKWAVIRLSVFLIINFVIIFTLFPHERIHNIATQFYNDVFAWNNNIGMNFEWSNNICFGTAATNWKGRKDKINTKYRNILSSVIKCSL